MVYYYKTKHPEITICKAGNKVVGIIGRVGALLDEELVLVDDDSKPVNREAWLFVDKASGFCSGELPTKLDAKKYCASIYN